MGQDMVDMTIGDLVKNYASLKEDLEILAKKPWSSESSVVFVETDEEGRFIGPQPQGFDYFLDMESLDHVIGDEQQELSHDQKIEALIYYASYDAFPPWLEELFGTSRSD